MNDLGVKPVVELKALTRSFEQGGERIDVLRGVDLAIRPGEIVALLGPSGSGKSTLLQAVGLLEGGFGGEIVIAGHSAEKSNSRARTALRRDHLGFVYQFHHLLPDFDALENVVLPQLVAGTPRAEAEARAQELLVALGLGHRLDHRPSQLAGGRRRPRPGEQARSRARRRTHRQSRRGDLGPGAGRVPLAGAWRGQRGADRNA